MSVDEVQQDIEVNTNQSNKNTYVGQEASDLRRFKSHQYHRLGVEPMLEDGWLKRNSYKESDRKNSVHKSRSIPNDNYKYQGSTKYKKEHKHHYSNIKSEKIGKDYQNHSEHKQKYDGPYDLPMRQRSKEAWLLLKAAHTLQQKYRYEKGADDASGSESMSIWRTMKSIINNPPEKEKVDVNPKSTRSRLAMHLVKTAQQLKQDNQPTGPRSSQSKRAWQLFKAANSAINVKETESSELEEQLQGLEDCNSNVNSPACRRHRSPSRIAIPIKPGGHKPKKIKLLKIRKPKHRPSKILQKPLEERDGSAYRDNLIYRDDLTYRDDPGYREDPYRERRRSGSQPGDKHKQAARLPRVQLLTSTEQPVKTSFLRKVYRQHGRPCVTDRFTLRSVKDQPSCWTWIKGLLGLDCCTKPCFCNG